MLSVLGAQPPSEGFGQTQKNVTIHEKHEIWSVFREFISKSPLDNPSFLVFRFFFYISFHRVRSHDFIVKLNTNLWNSQFMLQVFVAGPPCEGFV